MNLIKTIMLGCLLAIVICIIYLGNLFTEVNTPPEEYNDCKVFYYHPKYLYLKKNRNNISNSMPWITKDKQIVDELILTPGMEISIVKNSNNDYRLLNKDNEVVGETITYEEASLLIDTVKGLNYNGEKVVLDSYFGYINGKLVEISEENLLGQVSGCKEKNDKN